MLFICIIFFLKERSKHWIVNKFYLQFLFCFFEKFVEGKVRYYRIHCSLGLSQSTSPKWVDHVTNWSEYNKNKFSLLKQNQINLAIPNATENQSTSQQVTWSTLHCRFCVLTHVSKKNNSISFFIFLFVSIMFCIIIFLK